MTDPNALPDDDLTIPDEADLWRRLNPSWYPVDPKTGVRRLTTQAFQNYPGTMAMSVILASEVSGSAEVLRRYSGYGLGSFKAGLARQAQQRIIRAPTAEEPGHVHVVGRKSSPAQKQLRDGTVILVEPTPADPNSPGG